MQTTVGLPAQSQSSPPNKWLVTVEKWGKHPACRVFLLMNRKLEAYATNLQPKDLTVTTH